ncbi:menaquinone-dependent protoporphyrinogen IX dehydrogenase [Vibrio sp. S11_S32]|uniref:menaquinone-dependent protoporphyrinogen IX dehydrogenase n=1 Tax=Vibrio sp. S11_S32 TaxID=2720225 RepID=UPI0016805DEB|nr:menaquinone-dependent protoporphyrinogen IX dehydrogenase [Vibrio sp. S11_S32]
MKKYLILYSTTDGQTHKIANHIANQIGVENCQLLNLIEADDVDLTQYEKVIIGASIRYGHFNKKLYSFINKNEQQLQAMESFFYGVNLTARKEGKDTPEGSSYIQKFLVKSTWQPKLIGVFAGALYYPRYRWLDRVMIRLIMTMTGGETDTSKEVEYTNWEKVTEFALQIKQK